MIGAAASHQVSKMLYRQSQLGLWNRIIAQDGSFGALMRCLKIYDGLNTNTLRAGIGAFSPVLGFLPIRSRLLRTTKEPKADSFTVSPRSRQAVISLNTNSTKTVACARDNRAFCDAAAYRSSRLMVFGSTLMIPLMVS
jgi:hypothetical protein